MTHVSVKADRLAPTDRTVSVLIVGSRPLRRRLGDEVDADSDRWSMTRSAAQVIREGLAALGQAGAECSSPAIYLSVVRVQAVNATPQPVFVMVT